MSRKGIMALAASAVLGFAGAAAYAEKSTGDMVDDSVIATSVKGELIGSKIVSGTDINVEVYKGHVQLAGFVDSEEQKAEAIRIAQRVEGTKKVNDRMVVVDGETRSMGETVDDQVIQAKLKTALLDAEGMGKGMDINTEVREGEVLLSGYLPKGDYKNKAGEIAKSIEGVKKVHNYIDIKPED
jgi:hyperosmotically inducible protein